MNIETWFLGYRFNNLDKVKYCPVCGSKNIHLPNDLWEWVCDDCGCWWDIK